MNVAAPANRRKQASARDDGGRFKPGVSGNPSGRPKTDSILQGLARPHGPRAIEVLVDLMEHSKDGKVRRAAAMDLIHCGFGRPGGAVTEDAVRAFFEQMSDEELMDEEPV